MEIFDNGSFAVKRPVGRPAFQIDVNEILVKYSELHNWKRVAEFFDVSPKTLSRRLKESGYHRSYTKE